MTEPTPRATRAVSDDDKRAVKLYGNEWAFFRRELRWGVSTFWKEVGEPIPDTDQDASQVLADWERENSDG